MTKPSNLDAIEKTTGIAWGKWVMLLEKQNASSLPHREIADIAYEKLEGKLDNAGWWAQSVAVAYEQHIGRRKPGQRSDGTFEAAVSKTLNCSMDEAMKKWLHTVKGKESFADVVLAGEPSQTSSDKQRHWAVNLADGTRVNADVYPKSAKKVIFTITHAKIKDESAKERWQTFWKDFINLFD